MNTERFQARVRQEAEAKGLSLEEAAAALATEIPLGRVGSPEDIAQMITFLVFDRGSYVTGVEITMDGGLRRVVE